MTCRKFTSLVPLAVAILFYVQPLLLMAQSPADPDAEETDSLSTHTASFIPVGPRSEARWEGEGENMRVIATDPQALPPRRLYARQGETEVDIYTNLNRPTDPVPVVPGSLPLFIKTPGSENLAPQLFRTIDIPKPPGHYDIFFTRDRRQKGWKDGRTLILSSSATDFSANSVRFVNLSVLPIIAQVNDQRFPLGPGEVEVVPFKKDKVSIHVAFRTGERQRVVVNTQIQPVDDSRINAILYMTHSDRTPVAAAIYFQPDTLLSNDKTRVLP